MKKYLFIILFILIGCGEERPKTFSAYSNQPIIEVKKLNQEDKKALYTDTFNKNLKDFQGTTSEKLVNCLNGIMGDESGFAMFSTIVGRCALHYKRSPSTFYDE